MDTNERRRHTLGTPALPSHTGEDPVGAEAFEAKARARAALLAAIRAGTQGAGTHGLLARERPSYREQDAHGIDAAIDRLVLTATGAR